MRISVTIDDDLLLKAQQLTGIANHELLLGAALRALVERSASRRLSLLGGSEPQLLNIPRRRAPGVRER